MSEKPTMSEAQEVINQAESAIQQAQAFLESEAGELSEAVADDIKEGIGKLTDLSNNLGLAINDPEGGIAESEIIRLGFEVVEETGELIALLVA